MDAVVFCTSFRRSAASVSGGRRRRLVVISWMDEGLAFADEGVLNEDKDSGMMGWK